MQKEFLIEQAATVFGSGKIKKAPGTWGSLASLPILIVLSLLGAWPYMLLTVVFTVVAVYVAGEYGKGQDLKEIVIDEFVGLMVALFLVPLNVPSLLVVFLLFRFFDILKPFPISHLDRNVKGGFGVVLDDLVAGLFANAVFHFVLLKYFSEFFMF